jgi:hypothetical protein
MTCPVTAMGCCCSHEFATCDSEHPGLVSLQSYDVNICFKAADPTAFKLVEWAVGIPVK